MSYTIVYDRQFLQTSTGIIPMALYGCNNCTMPNPRTGREMREREWQIFTYHRMTPQMLNAPADELMNIVRGVCDGDDQQNFKYQGRWIGGEGEIRFFENGIKKAATLEALQKLNPLLDLDCCIVTQDQAGWHNQYNIRRVCKTTADIEAWVAEAKPVYDQMQERDEDPMIVMSFGGYTPLKKPRKGPSGGPVIATRGKNRYIARWDATGIYCSQDVANAHVFDNEAEALEQLPPSFVPFVFIDAKRALRPRPYVLRVSEGSWAGRYIKRLTRGKVYLSGDIGCAKRFHSEHEAQSWCETHRITGRAIEKV